MAFNWTSLDDQDAVSVPARPASGFWTPVRSYVGAGTLLRIQASGQWRPLPNIACGPDGLRQWPYGRDRLLAKAAPPGTLIGKIGGGTSYAAEADIIVIGSLCVLKLDKVEGPLFLTINDAPDGFEDNDGALTVSFS
ncbi:MAG TPA: hypothetical protein VE650_05425 [Acetobacteraceae bacterium]|jgi:hypothetical protein|nr:hypothetical protein [Acetobacteraceae bacterium]